MIIDTHLHPTNKVDEAWRHTGEPFTGERLLAMMDGPFIINGKPRRIDMGFIQPPPGNTVWRDGDRSGREGIRDYMAYITELVQKYPDRFIGDFTYNPRFGPENAAAELEFHVKEYGFKMMKLHANMHAYRPDRALDWLRPGLRKCDELGVVVLLHTGDGPYSIPTQFYPIIREFRDVNFIIGHFGVQTGGVYCFEALWMILDSPNVYGESGWLLQSRIVEFAKEMPIDRLVFGTDSPPNEPGMWLRQLEVLCTPPPQGLNCSEETLEGYMGNNVANLVGIEGTPPPASVEEAEARLQAGSAGPVSVCIGVCLVQPRIVALARCAAPERTATRSAKTACMAAAAGDGSQDLHDCLAEYRRQHPEDVVVMEERVSADQDVTALVWELAARGRRPGGVVQRRRRSRSPRHEPVRFSAADRATGSGLTQISCTRPTRHGARHARPMHEVETGPVLDHVAFGDDVDLTALPLITHFESDRGPYITNGIVVAEEPGSGAGNLSYHRAVVLSPNTFGTSLHSRGDLWRLLEAAAGASQHAAGGDGARRPSALHAGGVGAGAVPRRRARDRGRAARREPRGGADTGPRPSRPGQCGVRPRGRDRSSPRAPRRDPSVSSPATPRTARPTTAWTSKPCCIGATGCGSTSSAATPTST